MALPSPRAVSRRSDPEKEHEPSPTRARAAAKERCRSREEEMVLLGGHRKLSPRVSINASPGEFLSQTMARRRRHRGGTTCVLTPRRARVFVHSEDRASVRALRFSLYTRHHCLGDAQRTPSSKVAAGLDREHEAITSKVARRAGLWRGRARRWGSEATEVVEPNPALGARVARGDA